MGFDSLFLRCRLFRRFRLRLLLRRVAHLARVLRRLALVLGDSVLRLLAFMFRGSLLGLRLLRRSRFHLGVFGLRGLGILIATLVPPKSHLRETAVLLCAIIFALGLALLRTVAARLCQGHRAA